jgi:hypothetical protein
MKVGDILDALLVHRDHPDSKTNMAAIFALNTLYEQFCPQCINGGGEHHNGDARREIPAAAIEQIRASLTAALEGLEVAKHMPPRSPRLAIVPSEPEA